jgi:hypothetical protein
MGKFGDFDHGYPVDRTKRCIAKTARGRPCRKPALKAGRGVTEQKCADHGGQTPAEARHQREVLQDAESAPGTQVVDGHWHRCAMCERPMLCLKARCNPERPVDCGTCDDDPAPLWGQRLGDDLADEVVRRAQERYQVSGALTEDDANKVVKDWYSLVALILNLPGSVRAQASGSSSRSWTRCFRGTHEPLIKDSALGAAFEAFPPRA